MRSERGHGQIIVTSSAPLLFVAGLLVGFGTRLGNGCTSGHGVCGVARLSPRSIAATLTFVNARWLDEQLLALVAERPALRQFF